MVVFNAVKAKQIQCRENWCCIDFRGNSSDETLESNIPFPDDISIETASDEEVYLASELENKGESKRSFKNLS